MTEMDDNLEMMLHASRMILLSPIIFGIAVFVLPWLVGLYNPSVDYVNGKEMLGSIRMVGGGLLIAGSVFTIFVAESPRTLVVG